MVLNTVLITQCIGTCCAGIDIKYTTFRVIYTFQRQRYSTCTSIFNTAHIILAVLLRGTIGDDFAELANGSVVEDVYGFGSGEGVAELHLCGQVQEVVGDYHTFVGIVGHVAIGIVAVLCCAGSVGGVVPALCFRGGRGGIGYFLEFIGIARVRVCEVVDLAVGPAGGLERLLPLFCHPLKRVVTS